MFLYVSENVAGEKFLNQVCEHTKQLTRLNISGCGLTTLPERWDWVYGAGLNFSLLPKATIEGRYWPLPCEKIDESSCWRILLGCHELSMLHDPRSTWSPWHHHVRMDLNKGQLTWLIQALPIKLWLRSSPLFSSPMIYTLVKLPVCKNES